MAGKETNAVVVSQDDVKPLYQLVKWVDGNWVQVGSGKRSIVDGWGRTLSKSDGLIYGVCGWRVLEQPSDKPFALFYQGQYFMSF